MILGALLALPAPSSSQAAESGAVAYPNNPGGTPSANDGGKPVALGKEACTHPGCPDVPGAAAGNAGNDTKADQKPGVRAPATAYPGAPVKTPATAADGQAPK